MILPAYATLRRPKAVRRDRAPMNMARVQSFAFSGIEAVPVEVQVQISSGLPAFL